MILSFYMYIYIIYVVVCSTSSDRQCDIENTSFVSISRWSLHDDLDDDLEHFVVEKVAFNYFDREYEGVE